MSNAKQFAAVVPAAGVGSRMQADKPKQYLSLNGKTLLEQTLNKLITHPQIEHIYLVLSDSDDYFNELPCCDADWLTRVKGGKERADSVLAGVEAASQRDWVLVHDAARPCVSHEDISDLLALADTGSVGGILATPVRDTMKRAAKNDPGRVSHTESRDQLWHALTPQFFPTKALLEALRSGLDEGVQITDEASAIESAGGEVKLIEGSEHNIKVTRPDDLALASYFLQQEAH